MFRRIQKSKNPKTFRRISVIFGFLDFWVFGFWGFWIFGFLDLGILSKIQKSKTFRKISESFGFLDLDFHCFLIFI